MPLFDRVGRSVQLTRAGAFFANMHGGLAGDGAGSGGHRRGGRLAAGTLTVGVVQTVNAYLIPEIVSRFSTLHPRVVLKFDELSGPEIEAGVTNGLLELGIGFVPAGSDRIESQLLFEEDFVVIAAPRHRFARRRRLPLAALADEPLVLLPSIFCTRRLLNTSFEQAGVVPRVTVEMNSIEGILATVKTSNLATVLPRLSLGLEEMPDFEVFRSTIRHPTGAWAALEKGRLPEQGGSGVGRSGASRCQRTLEAKGG